MEKAEMKPPPAGGEVGYFENVDQNYLWIVLDGSDKLSYYHALSVASFVKKDIRVAAFNFKVKLKVMEDVFTKAFLESSKSEISTLKENQIVKNSFLKNLNPGDIIIATGGEKMLHGISALSNNNDELFCYFGATKNINFDKDAFDCDLFSIFATSLKEEDFDDDNVIPINPKTVFIYNFKTEKLLSAKVELDYIFVVFPHLTDKKKNELYRAYNFGELSVLSFGFSNLIEAIKLCYNFEKKIIVISDLVEDEDYEIEIAIKGLLSKALASRIKIKFLFQNYGFANKIPTSIEHLYINTRDKIILPSDDTCNILNFIKHGVQKENILYFKHLLEKESIFKTPFGVLEESEILQVKALINFNEQEIEALKMYKSETIHIKNVAKYIAYTLVTQYTEDAKNRDTQTEQEEEEPEIIDFETEEEVEEMEDSTDSEEMDETEDIEEKEEKKIEEVEHNPELMVEQTLDLETGEGFLSMEEMESLSDSVDVDIETIKESTENLEIEDPNLDLDVEEIEVDVPDAESTTEKGDHVEKLNEAREKVEVEEHSH